MTDLVLNSGSATNQLMTLAITDSFCASVILSAKGSGLSYLHHMTIEKINDIMKVKSLGKYLVH